MSRLLPRAGLAIALVFTASGTVLLLRPAQATPPITADEVTVTPLIPADDPPRPHPTASASAPGLTAPQPPALAGTRVVVPRLRIDLPVALGDVARDIGDQATPTSGAFLLPGSAMPGTRGNAYVYAHARPGLFLSLWNVRLGDIVEIGVPTGLDLRYVVTEIHPRVDPTDERYLSPTSDERLTLQTSTGPWVLSPRFVVVAQRAP